jgi:carboxyl-terminal processing protease
VSFSRIISASLFAIAALAQMPPKEQAAQLASFELVWSTIRDRNPDPKINGLNWKAIHDSFEPRIQKAKSTAEVRGILREMIAKPGLSHYAIIPRDLYTEAGDTSQPAGSGAGIDTVIPDGKAVVKAAPPPNAAGQSAHAGPESGEQQSSTVEFGNLPKMRVEFESKMVDGGIGYIRFNEFLDPIALMPRFESALSGFTGAPGVILDLRGNAGGIGIMAMGIAGFFVGDAGHKLGEMKMRDTTLQFNVFPRPQPYMGRLAILLDRGSASTTEILAQGLQDLNRARIFGTQSAGAALTSDIIRLPDGDGFQYPTANYISVNGRVLEGNGVIPDVEVHQNKESIAAGRDPVIEAAAKWIQTP